MVHMAPAMYFCMIPCQQIGMGKILGMPESFVDTCHLLKQKAYKCTIVCMHVRGCQPDDIGPKLSPKLPQFCKDVKIHWRPHITHFSTTTALAPKIRKTGASLKHEIVSSTPSNAGTCLLER